jgi:hypothetical protein
MVARLLAVAVLLISTTASCLEAGDTEVGANLESVTPTSSIPPTPGARQRGQTPEAHSIAEAATTYGLPDAFFRRLIWQESRFNPRAVSHAGAQGIAQFMPGTARWRGLSDPFDPSTALFASARWLRELWVEFGNLGLAAAAYNGGPQRVRNWLKGQDTLPAETRAYVLIITGRSAMDWAGCSREPTRSCGELASRAVVHDPVFPELRTRSQAAAWGLQLIGDPSEAKALANFRVLQARYAQVIGGRKPLVIARRLPGRGSATWYQVRLAEGTREGANNLCSRLKQAGGGCVVLRN